MIKTDTHNFFLHFFRGAVHYGIGGFISKIFVLVNISIILASVDPYQYGVYKLVFSLYLVINGLLLSGLNGLVLNDVISYRSTGEYLKARKLFSEFVITKITLGLMALLFFYFFANLIGNYYSEGVSIYLKILSILFLADAFTTIIETSFKIKLDFFGANIIATSFEMSKFLVLCYFVFLNSDGLNIVNLCITAVSSSILSLIVISIYSYKKQLLNLLTLDLKGAVLILKLFGTYGKWAIAKNYISIFVDNLRLWIIKIFISTEAVAIFSVAVSLFTTLKKIIPTQSIVSLIPSYIKNPIALRDIYAHITKLFIWIFIVLLFIGYLFVPVVVDIIAPKYIDSVIYFKIIIFSIIFSSMILNKQIIYSFRRQRFLFFLTIIEFVSISMIGTILASQFGLYGISLELLLTEFIIFMITYRYLLKTQPDLRFSWKDIIKFSETDKRIISFLWNKIINKFQINSK